MQNKTVTYRSLHDVPKPVAFSSNSHQGRLTTVQRSGHIWRTQAGYFVPQNHNYVQRVKTPSGRPLISRNCQTFAGAPPAQVRPMTSDPRDTQIRALQQELRSLRKQR